MTEPQYLVPTKDPAFGTSFTRITEPGRFVANGVSCKQEYCTHRYSSSQAWNADQSLVVIANGCGGGFCFLDGQTYRPLFHRRVPNECEWHPVDATKMICVSSQAVYLWTPRSNDMEAVFAPTDYTKLQFGPWKGNPSRDGARLVIRATDKTGKNMPISMFRLCRARMVFAASRRPGSMCSACKRCSTAPKRRLCSASMEPSFSTGPNITGRPTET
jgi:hypothetical protein